MPFALPTTALLALLIAGCDDAPYHFRVSP